MVILAAVMIVSMQLFGGVITSLFVDEPEIIAMDAVLLDMAHLSNQLNANLY